MQIPSRPDLETRAVHAGREDLRTLGVHALPLDLSSTYPFTDLDRATASLDALVSGDATAENPVYARLLNPTVARFENALADLEGAEAAVAYSSGMAALTAVLLAAKMEGKNHVVATRPIYGTTDHLLSCDLLGVETTWVSPEAVGDAIRPDTALVMTETPTNPTLALVDIESVVRQAAGVPVLVDSTFATPVLQRPLAHGAAMVMHSATKYLGGHGDVVAGVVACGEAWARKLRQVRVATGALLHPLGGYLLHRGLQTLPVRIERAQTTASDLARRLSAHPDVQRVYFPGLDGNAHLLGTQMDGPGTMVAFEVAGHEMASGVLRSVQLMTPAVSLGSVDTLIQHPAGLTHRVVGEAGRAQGGVSEGLLRVSVGLESADALWADLEGALASAARLAPSGAVLAE
ncbi:trans-sulfuration enzyme family protein [Rubricoccus marinus]|uniref:Cystathionine gamma-synthase n=1 Tax=Rubricoccus marinus TaxID=716817 RepID=A0A259TV89_9BACT|nr:PLP-dependent aspartate aminotransferase family protein [Rubricoccus marinus]OZC01537.1 cystathionine gamma-synthase [Rubricoccus marinus]